VHYEKNKKVRSGSQTTRLRQLVMPRPGLRQNQSLMIHHDTKRLVLFFLNTCDAQHKNLLLHNITTTFKPSRIVVARHQYTQHSSCCMTMHAHNNARARRRLMSLPGNSKASQVLFATKNAYKNTRHHDQLRQTPRALSYTERPQRQQ